MSSQQFEYEPQPTRNPRPSRPVGGPENVRITVSFEGSNADITVSAEDGWSWDTYADNFPNAAPSSGQLSIVAPPARHGAQRSTQQLGRREGGTNRNYFGVYVKATDGTDSGTVGHLYQWNQEDPVKNYTVTRDRTSEKLKQEST